MEETTAEQPPDTSGGDSGSELGVSLGEVPGPESQPDLLKRFGLNLHIFKVVLRIAAPFMGAMLLRNVIGIIDFKMVGALVPVPPGGEQVAVQADALAALSVSRMTVFVIASTFLGFGSAVSAFVSQNYGADNRKAMRAYATISAVLAVLGALVIGAAIFLWGQGSLGWLDPSARVQDFAWDYLSVYMAGLSLIAVNLVFINTFNALGRTEYTLYGQIGINLFNIAGNYYFISIWGLAGAAFSTVISTLAVVILFAWKLYSDRVIGFGREILDKLGTRVKKLGELALPATAQMLTRSVSMLMVYWVISLIPAALADQTAGTAALGLGIMTIQTAFLPVLGFSVTATALTGQSLGEGSEERARRATVHATLMAIALLVVMAVVFQVFAEPIVTYLASGNEEVIPEAVNYLRYYTPALPFAALSMTLIGCFRGAGDMNASLVISFISRWLLRLPVCYYFAAPLEMGLSGVWLGLAVSTTVEALICLGYYQWGNWTRFELATD